MLSSIKSQSRYKRQLLRASQLQFLYVQFSIHYSIQSVIVVQWNRQTDRQSDISMFPYKVIFVSKMFLTPKSIKNSPISTSTQINAWNIAKAAIIIRKIGKKFGVIKLGMCMMCCGFNSQQIRILMVTTYVNNRTAWQNAQRRKEQ